MHSNQMLKKDIDITLSNKVIRFSPHDWKNPDPRSEKATVLVLQHHINNKFLIEELNKRASRVVEQYAAQGAIKENSNNFHITIGMIFPKQSQLQTMKKIIESIEEQFSKQTIELTITDKNDLFGYDKLFPVALVQSAQLQHIYDTFLSLCKDNNIEFKKNPNGFNPHISLLEKPLAKDEQIKAIQTNNIEIKCLSSGNDLMFTHQHNGKYYQFHANEIATIIEEINKHCPYSPILFQAASVTPVIKINEVETKNTLSQ